jgi:SAM-dependent methyltransferase
MLMQPNLPAMPVDMRAQAAWGDDASAYERARPGWPPEALDWLFAELGRPKVVLDLAAGTGKLTGALAERAERVIAVEPLAAMRAQNPHPCVEGTAQAIPVDDGAVDAVFVGEAFHWFANHEAWAEIRRVSRGGLAVLWNFELWQDEPWLPELAQALPTGVATHHPTPRGTWDVIDVPVRERRFRHRHHVEDFGALVGTWSRVANLDDPTPVIARARELVPGAVDLDYETLAVAASWA